MDIVRDAASLQALLAAYRAEGARVGFVPTMGALHEGHLSLVDVAHAHCDVVAASIFVNPKQFAPGEDFDAYPRTEMEDLALLESRGVSVAYVPSVDAVYNREHDASVKAGSLAQGLCSDQRPHFFDGVVLVVKTLFDHVQPDVAVFGEKDYQQLCVIRQLVSDLNLSIDVVGGPTVREPDGLALSSRNRYLTPEEREIAPLLYKILSDASSRFVAGEAVHDVLDESTRTLSQHFTVDYFELRDALSLEPLSTYHPPARLFGAVTLGKTRLIDNMPVL